MVMQGCSIYLSHGGGPLPILGDATHARMNAFMQDLPKEIALPKAIVVVSAHWEEAVPTICGGQSTKLHYDYYGFPKESYELKYPIRGDEELSDRIRVLVKARGFEPGIDHDRGFDHGVFIPLMLMYPDASIPVVQISLVKGLDPLTHIHLGEALKPLMNENVLLIGSGFSFHNMKAFDWAGGEQKDDRNNDFQNHLKGLFASGTPRAAVQSELISWTQMPHARYCHPREEHLLPLHVCFGAASGASKILFDDYILGKRAIALRWG
jgi:4,5-DOPA dioxygenase extradiol